MAAKQQTLQTNIILNGKVAKSFDAIGDKLKETGELVNQVSQALINFGKESVEEYVGYEEAMKEIYSLGEYTYADMQKLHQLNKETAQNSVYTNTELANAELLIAQAGVQVNDVYTLLPNVLKLATVGSLDMADSVDYLVSSLNSLGLGMDYAGTLTDQMAKTAALGMTDIDTLGESLTRLGSASGQFFKGGSAEILTILSTMSQFGEDMRGSNAGTQLRNFMLSLAAPASNIEEMADAMRELGYAEDEIDEYLNGRSNGSAARAIEVLKEAGLQIYDTNGNLLPAIDIIKSLRKAVYGNTVYAEDMEEFGAAFAQAGSDVETFMNASDGLTDNALFTLMSQIFGKRTATTALNLISIDEEEWNRTLAEIENSDGYAQNAMDIMEGGLSGSLKKLNTAFSELKTTVGEHLAPIVQTVADALHGIVTDVSNWDETKWSAVVAVGSTLAAAGPTLLITAGAFKAIAALSNPLTLSALAVTGAVATIAAIEAVDWQDFKDAFGDMDVSSAELSTYIDSLGDSFEDAYADVNSFSSALMTAVDSYTTASRTFKSSLITKMLTKTNLTDDDIESLEALGDTMYSSILDGISNATARDMAAITATFGGEGVAEDSSVWANLIQVLNIGYEAAIEQAEGLSQQLRDAMTSAFDDGVLTSEEVLNIQSIMDEMNRVMAIQVNAENYASQRTLLHKAQTMGLDSLQSISEEELARQQEVMESLYESQNTTYGSVAAYLDYMIENGLTYTDENGNEVLMTREYANQLLVELLEEQAKEASRYHLNFLPFTWDLYNTAIGESDELGGSWGFLKQYAEEALAAGGISNDLMRAYQENVGAKERGRLAEYTGWMIEAMGGVDQIEADIETMLASGDTENANLMRTILQMANLATLGQFQQEASVSYGSVETYSPLGAEYTLQDVRDMIDANTDSNMGFALKELEYAIENGDAGAFLQMMTMTDTGFITGLNNAVEAVKTMEGFDTIEVPKNLEYMSDYYRMYKMLYGSDQIVHVTDNEEGQELKNKLETKFEEPITQHVRISYGSLNIPSGTIRAGMPGITKDSLYAEGGRADTPSIFGEAGAEWAIPEEHTARTAALLDAARAASGFTWPELLSMSGGLNAGGSKSVTLAYSPTIYATDATDVEEKLLQDKSRMERWLRERQLRREVEAYA